MLSSMTWGTVLQGDYGCENDASTSSVLHDGDDQNIYLCPISNRRAKQRVKASHGREVGKPAVFADALDALLMRHIVPVYSEQLPMQPACGIIDWTQLPRSVHPAGGLLPPERIHRKTIQVENMMQPCMSVISMLMRLSESADWRDVASRSSIDDSVTHTTSRHTSVSASEITRDMRARRVTIKIVEFCAGSGFVALPLAAMYPQCEFVLIDSKLKSMDIARSRVEEASLTNVTLLEQRIEEYHDPFDLGIGLHACGAATDVAINKCIQQRAGFVMCPCCIGKILFHHTLPCSKQFESVLAEVFSHHATCYGIIPYESTHCRFKVAHS
jgi:Methyltransferase domain